MEGTNAYDDNGNDLDVKDVFQEEVSEDGSGNLNAITLYSYATTFLVTFLCKFTVLNYLSSNQPNPLRLNPDY
mgnify:CR=1 FL=1